MAFRKKLVLYVAHALSYRKDVKSMTEKLEKDYYIRFINPFYNIKRPEIEALDSLKSPEERESYKKTWSKKDCDEIVRMDLEMIDESDGLLAFLTTGVFGTACELQYARTTNRKIFVITKIYGTHPWVRCYADSLFENIDEFKKWLDDNGYKRKTPKA